MGLVFWCHWTASLDRRAVVLVATQPKVETAALRIQLDDGLSVFCACAFAQ
jgi:hypothetical protein